MPATSAPEQQIVTLDAIRPVEDFNPRGDVERAALDRLADSIREHGVIQPLVVARADGDGGHRLIDGERRYRACLIAGVGQVPVIVREGRAETSGLEVALVANMARVNLSIVEEAKGFQRLVDHGFTRKGVAEKLGVSQKLVRERLALLDLDEALQPRLADGTIPPGAVKALCELAAIHPDLPAVAVAAILDAPKDEDDYYSEAPTWSELVRDPLGLVASVGELPPGVFQTHVRYPLTRFSLNDATSAALDEYSEITRVDRDGVAVTLGHDELAAADALGAAHRSRHGVSALIVGQEVADQLVADQIAAALETERNAIEQRTAQHDGAGTPGDPGTQAADDEAAQQERRRQRGADQQARRQAVAYNDALAAAIVGRLGKVRVDERVVKILAAVDLGDQLDKLALRGARYGFPGFESQEQLKSGKVKRTYLAAGDAGARARTWLTNAKRPGELAGRAIALVAMARYADESAVAQSARAFWSVDGGRTLPWSSATVDLLDDLCEESLPAHLLDRGREQRDADRARRTQLRDDEEWFATQLDGLAERSPEERAQLLAEAKERSGPYSSELWRLESAIAGLDAAEPRDETAGGEEG